MKISYMSDLHTEFGMKNFELPGGDILLLAGDIVVINALIFSGKYYEDHAKKGENHVFHKIMQEQFSKYSKVYAILGNHEHYGNDVYDTYHQYQQVTEKYPFFKILNNEAVELAPGWKLFGATLWTNYNGHSYRAMDCAEKCMNDHWVIRRANTRFTAEDAFQFNLHSRTEIARAVIDSPDNWIVMTHHTPSMKSCHPRWNGDGNLSNYAFHNTDLDEFIVGNSQIKYWLHGHTHDSSDYILGETRVLCNPKGYSNENKQFDHTLSFEVNT